MYRDVGKDHLGWLIGLIFQVYFDKTESSENKHSIINVGGALIKYASYVHIVTSKKIRIEHHSKCWHTLHTMQCVGRLL